jgi:molecular chaperone GrpE (heat shock protein)
MSSPSFSHRLAEAWRVLRGDATAPPPAGAGEARALDAEAALGGLRLEVDEARQDAVASRRALDAERAARQEAVAAALAERLEPALADAAAALAQLGLQERLSAEGKPVGAADVLALVRALGRAMERLGLVPVGQPGDAAAFDPTAHQPLAGPAPAPGTAVQVRMSGYRLHGRLIRKAMVVPNS